MVERAGNVTASDVVRVVLPHISRRNLACDTLSLGVSDMFFRPSSSFTELRRRKRLLGRLSKAVQGEPDLIGKIPSSHGDSEEVEGGRQERERKYVEQIWI